MNITRNSVLDIYRNHISQGHIDPDPAQALVVEKLNLLALRLERPSNHGGFASALFGWGRERVSNEALQGLYIYGPVGRGKSILMQYFVDAVGDLAWRVHFHEFMQWVQSELQKRREAQERDPIHALAKYISQNYLVLCLDEMQIENIADAMIVGRLFEAIFAGGTVLVTTSNRHPNALYSGGLNRKRFLPFIDIIETHCEVINLAGGRDYRQGGNQNRIQIGGLDDVWKGFGLKAAPHQLHVQGREWILPCYAKRHAWLSFAELCEENRGVADYQALAEAVDVILIDQIPILSPEKTSAISRFVNLVDILYEAKTETYLGLAAPLDELHHDPGTQFIFDRTCSRLAEMGREA